MRLFQNDLIPLPDAPNWYRFLRQMFLIGVVLRLGMAGYSIGYLQPDEHQQYVEQAFRLVHGYGTTFWEQQLGIRHPLLSTLNAGILTVPEALGIENPFVAGAFLRSVWSITLLAVWLMFADALARRGQRDSGVILALLGTVLPDSVYFQLRTLSESAAFVPLILSTILLSSRPFAAGLLLGIGFGIRFQFGFWVAGVWFVCLAQNRGRPFVKLSLGLTLALLAMGAWDYFTLGRWFHSPRAYVNANVVHQVSNAFGEEPWWYYFATVSARSVPFGVALLVMMARGMIAERRFVIPFLMFVIPHCIVAHKETRFLLPMLPIFFLFMSEGALKQLTHMPGIVAARWILIPLLMVLRSSQIPWSEPAFHATAVLLNELRHRSDVEAVFVEGLPRSDVANHFYLRQNVPIYYSDQEPAEHVAEGRTRANFFLTRSEPGPGEIIAESDGWRAVKRR